MKINFEAYSFEFEGNTVQITKKDNNIMVNINDLSKILKMDMDIDTFLEIDHVKSLISELEKEIFFKHIYQKLSVIYLNKYTEEYIYVNYKIALEYIIYSKNQIFKRAYNEMISKIKNHDYSKQIKGTGN